jgi:hypothetical protein
MNGRSKKDVFGIALLAAAAALASASPAAAKRAPTYLEKMTVVAAFNTPRFAYDDACLSVTISTADPRYAEAGPSDNKACRKAKAVPDWYELFRRSSPASLHWTHIFSGNGTPSCKTVPPRVMVDLVDYGGCSK